MIGPKTHCPRCNVIYGGKDSTTDDYEFIYCIQCGFRYYDDADSMCIYAFEIQNNELKYRVYWLGDHTDVWISNKPSADNDPDDNICITLNHWLPFDVTSDTLKLYITFS